MTPDSQVLPAALTLVALLLAALGAVMLLKGAREDSQAPSLDLTEAGLGADLRGPVWPAEALLERFDPLMQAPPAPSDEEFRQLLAFLTNGLLAPKARPENLRNLIPTRLPSGRPVHNFQL